MTMHPHAAFDHFPQLVNDLKEEFGSEGLASVVEHFIDAERADFYWDSRIAETRGKPIGDDWELTDGPTQKVDALGFYRGRYYVAAFIVDQDRRVEWMTKARHYDDFAGAEAAFATVA